MVRVKGRRLESKRLGEQSMLYRSWKAHQARGGHTFLTTCKASEIAQSIPSRALL